MDNLYELELGKLDAVTDEFLIRVVSGFTNLRSLNLYGCKNLTINGVLVVLRLCKNLSFLTIPEMLKNSKIVLESFYSSCQINFKNEKDVWLY